VTYTVSISDKIRDVGTLPVKEHYHDKYLRPMLFPSESRGLLHPG